MTTSTNKNTQSSLLSEQVRKVMPKVWGTSLTLIILAIFLMPLGYGIITSLKSPKQIEEGRADILPSTISTFNYEGKDYDIYQVPTDSGTKKLALVKKGREESSFVDPANPEAGLIEWTGRWRTLELVVEYDIEWSNYPKAWETIDFILLFRNTLMYCILSTIGAVISSAFVAYGFARFNFPRKNFFFAIVMSTIILPGAVTLIPTYAFFSWIGWVGTWLPLIVPVYFSNAYNVFLLRQFFLGIPRDLDEAATIDGAGPLRIFISIILPNSIPALTAVTLFHFFFAWNDFFLPLVYLAGKSDLFPITLGLNSFNGLYTAQTNLIQAAALMASVVPILIFFFAQRAFLQGVVVAGAEK